MTKFGITGDQAWFMLAEIADGVMELNPDIEADTIEFLAFITERIYGEPASEGEILLQAKRLLGEALIPGRTIEISPTVTVREDEALDLNGTILTTVLNNVGVIFDEDGLFGDNLLSGVVFNEGLINLDSGEDFVVGFGGGIFNASDGEIFTGAKLDLISGSSSGVENTKGIFNFGGFIDSGTGNDRIVGNAIGIIDAEGIENSEGGRIVTGRGDDLIDGEAAAVDEAVGIENELGSTISTGVGDDIVRGRADDLTGLTATAAGQAGILNDSGSLIKTGGGNDLVEGYASVDDSGDTTSGQIAGIANFSSTISLGGGADDLIGEAFSVGGQETTAGIISFGNGDSQGVLDLGKGDDLVLGFAETSGTGFTNGIVLVDSSLVSRSGNNFIQGEAVGGFVNSGLFISSSSSIKLGGGNDVVVGFAFEGFESNEGITNRGKISLGAGDDIIESLFGDFGGEGTTSLGRGNDVIVGFGTGNFNGGAGQDIIKLTTGIYRFDDNTLTREEDGVSMGLRRVEGLSGLADEEALLLVDGATYIVGENNSAVFI